MCTRQLKLPLDFSSGANRCLGDTCDDPTCWDWNYLPPRRSVPSVKIWSPYPGFHDHEDFYGDPEEVEI